MPRYGIVGVIEDFDKCQYIFDMTPLNELNTADDNEWNMTIHKFQLYIIRLKRRSAQYRKILIIIF